MQAAAQAKQELMPLVVYLHSDDHHDTPEFCRCGSVLAESRVCGACVDLVRSSEMK